MCSLDEFLGGIINLSHSVCLIQIPVVPLVIGCHINIDNVSILQWPLVWYAMTNDLHRARPL